MRPQFALIVAALLTPAWAQHEALALPASSARTDIRAAAWGMTKAQVLAAESRKPSRVRESNGEAVVEYDGFKLGGLDARLVYIFDRDKLVRARYLLDAQHGDENEFIGDFQAAEALLKDAYGAPSADQALWSDDSTQDEPKSYLDQDRATATGILQSDRFVGLAVSLGHLKLFTRRSAGRTKMLHALTGGNHRITHVIEFQSADAP
jgi:hypothetical protein